ncbi:hypothetical protein P5673_017317 [Acropora cervicornis]|uniref:Uncharacterized protein n=1 Tax=Acropora cervicornis TaxID=6130 RepID=A0AAD9QFH1_ACRCE|nr:hypothetical protein P5673_017317 [Acropora cervicornis]
MVIAFVSRRKVSRFTVLILWTLIHKLVFRNKRHVNHSSVSVTRFIRRFPSTSSATPNNQSRISEDAKDPAPKVDIPKTLKPSDQLRGN